MASRTILRRLALALSLAGLLFQSGCLWLPRQGTPVYVDHRAGDFWSGKAVLVKVSADGSRCRVHVRNRAGVVEGKWVLCKHVHPRRS